MIMRLRRDRRLRDALLVVASSLLLLMAFTIHAAPVLGGLHDPIAAIGIRLAMGAAYCHRVPRRRVRARHSRERKSPAGVSSRPDL